MSWHCSQALAAAFSEVTCSAGALSAPSNTTPTPAAFYWPDKTTEHSRLSRFGMTSEPLTEDRGAALLTSYRAAFPARTSAWPARVTDSTASGPVFGRKWLGSLAKYDRDSRSWRTAQRSLLEDSEEFLATWPRWGSMRNGECWERMTSELHTSGSASGLWPTPVADDTGSRSKKYAQGGTPLSLAVKVFPMPTTIGMNGGSNSRKAVANRGDEPLHIGPLNPEWVEWLMGWPIGWTDLKPLETGRFQEWQQQHSPS